MNIKIEVKGIFKRYRKYFRIPLFYGFPDGSNIFRSWTLLLRHGINGGFNDCSDMKVVEQSEKALTLKGLDCPEPGKARGDLIPTFPLSQLCNCQFLQNLVGCKTETKCVQRYQSPDYVIAVT